MRIAEFGTNEIKIEIIKKMNGKIGMYLGVRSGLLDSAHISTNCINEFFEVVQKALYYIQTTCEKQADGTWQPK